MTNTIIGKMGSNLIWTFSNIKVLTVFEKVLSLVIAFLYPVKELFYLMFVFLLINSVSGIYKNVIRNKEKFSTKKFRCTFEKLISYLIMILLIYIFENILLHSSGYYITRIVTGLVVLIEFKGITENFDFITGQKVFTKIFKEVNKLFTNGIK